VSATRKHEDIEDLILRLDDKSAAAIKLKLYALRYADATGVAKLSTTVCRDPQLQAARQNRGAAA